MTPCWMIYPYGYYPINPADWKIRDGSFQQLGSADFTPSEQLGTVRRR
jgi:hypothetical protein